MQKYAATIVRVETVRVETLRVWVTNIEVQSFVVNKFVSCCLEIVYIQRVVGIYQRREGEGVKIYIDTLGSSFLIIMLKISASAFSSALIGGLYGIEKTYYSHDLCTCF